MTIHPLNFFFCKFNLFSAVVGVLLFTTGIVPAQSDAIEFREANVSVNGFTIHYRAGGNGPYLLMLHGFTLTGEEWMPFAKDFAANHTVIVADLPGHGGSSPLPSVFSFAKAAQLMHGLLDQLGAVQVSGIGHSGGGITLLHMAAQRPQRITSMVLVAGPYRMGSQASAVVQEDTFERLEPAAKEFYRNLHPGGEEQAKFIYRQYNELVDSKEEIAPEVMATLPMPVLLIWGDRDPYFPLAIPIEMYHLLPNAKLWVIPGQGHTPLWVNMGGDTRVAARFIERATSFLLPTVSK